LVFDLPIVAQSTVVCIEKESVQCAITGPCLCMRHTPSLYRFGTFATVGFLYVVPSL